MSERAGTGQGATIGVDVGGTSISGGRVPPAAQALPTVETPPQVSGPGRALKTLLAVIHEVHSRARAQGLSVDGIGVGLPGLVDVDKGMISMFVPQSHVPEFYGVPIAEQIQALTDLPT